MEQAASNIWQGRVLRTVFAGAQFHDEFGFGNTDEELQAALLGQQS